MWPDMEFVKSFTLPDFQAKNFTPSISPNLHRWEKFYTAAGSDGIDKFHLCSILLQSQNYSCFLQ